MLRYILSFSLCIPPCSGLAAEPDTVGRLFFSAGERSKLDRMRQQSGKDFGASAEGAVRPADIESNRITVDGFVRRSSGKSTTWINRTPQTERDVAQGISVLQQSAKPPAITLRLESGKQIHLKAGQAYDAGTGKIEDLDAPPESR